MAMITYPLDNIDYSAADAGLFHCTRKSGVWAEDSFPISASGSDNSITIGSGVAWISNDKYWGKVVAQKEEVTVGLEIADSVYNRIDAVVIQFNSNANATNIVVKKGTPATRPLRPEIVQTESIFELCLCEVLRPAGSSVVTSANVTDTRMNDVLCGLMADSVTKVDMTAIEAQVKSLINNLQNEIDSVRNLSGIMFESEWVEGDVIPVLKGGTGAKTAEESLANLGGMSMKLLWENPSPTSEYPVQNLNIDLSNFDEVEIVFGFVNGNSPMEINRKVKVGGQTLCCGIYGNSSNMYGAYRQTSVNVDKIAFNGAWYTTHNSDNLDNKYCIPLRIYGIKGVQ